MAKKQIALNIVTYLDELAGRDLVPASAVTANACPLFYSWLLIE